MGIQNIKSKAYSALLWSFVELIGLRGIQFIIGIVLARLLMPDQYGLIGMLTLFMAIAQSILDSGFGSALIQKRMISQMDCCSIFYFNILVGCMMAALLCLAAPSISIFYHQPILVPLTRVMSLVIVINSFGLIQKTIRTRKIEFKNWTIANLIASALSGIIGIFMAVRGCGVWSLAVQQISLVLFLTFLMWKLSEWRPSLLFSFQSLRNMFGYGSRVLMTGLLNTIFDNIYYLIIGRLYSSIELGYYSRATSLEEMPSQTLSGMVSRVAFPVFSTIQNDLGKIKRGMKKAIGLLVLVNFPIMIGLAIVANPLVLVLLTEKWAPCIVFLRWLCILGLMFPLQKITSNVLQAIGRSGLVLRLEILKKMMIVINIVITWRWGINAMIIGQILITFISYYINAYCNQKLLQYSIAEQTRDLLPYVSMSLTMGLVVLLVGMIPFSTLGIKLIIQTISGVVVYVYLCHRYQINTYHEIVQMIRSRVTMQRMIS
jgi:teichuronic acid exporter